MKMSPCSTPDRTDVRLPTPATSETTRKRCGALRVLNRRVVIAIANGVHKLNPHHLADGHRLDWSKVIAEGE